MTWVKWTRPSLQCNHDRLLLSQFDPYFRCSFGNQGDSECPERNNDATKISYATVANQSEALGIDCFIRTMPPGHGFRLRGTDGHPEYRLNILYNDMRLGADSDGTKLYIEAAVRVMAENAQPAPAPVELALTKWFMPAHPAFPADAWQTPAEHASVHWVSHRMPYAGRVVYSRVHMHQRFADELWVTAGASESLIFGSTPSPDWTRASK